MHADEFNEIISPSSCCLLGWLILGLVFSILAEWLGMTFWWPEEGARATAGGCSSRKLGHLTASVPGSLVDANTAASPGASPNLFYHYGFEVTRIPSGVERLNAPAQPQDATRLKISRILYAPTSSYLLAAITITQVYAVRLGVLCLATPVFALAGVVGLTDGLIERDRRRFEQGAGDRFCLSPCEAAHRPECRRGSGAVSGLDLRASIPTS